MSYYRHGPHRPSGMGIGVPSMTPFIKIIIIVNVAVWFLQFLSSVLFPPSEPGMIVNGFRTCVTPAGHAVGNLECFLGSVPDFVRSGWIWQPVTYMFLHDPRGPMHILFNMLMVWMFGSELERLWGGRAFLRYYLVCGTGGGICSTLLGLAAGGPNALFPTIGASGALFGIFVAYGIVFARQRILFMLLFPIQARTMALLLVGINLFFLMGQSGSNVSHIAHLGGALAGFLYLKRAWRVGEFYRELRWKLLRRRFKSVPRRDDDHWVN